MTRDPDPAEQRADLLVELVDYWRRYPELRLGQLIHNVKPVDLDIFYVEDETLLGVLHRANAEGRPLSEADLHR